MCIVGHPSTYLSLNHQEVVVDVSEATVKNDRDDDEDIVDDGEDDDEDGRGGATADDLNYADPVGAGRAREAAAAAA